MNIKLKSLAVAVGSTIAFGAALPASAQISGDVIKIGFITDMSGAFSDIDGPGGLEAVKMAIADMGGSINGKKIELLVADHQNKADIASSKAREWFDQQGLDVMIGGVNSAASLAMIKIAAERKKPFFAVGAVSTRITNEDCTPYTLHYGIDTYAGAKGTGAAVVRQGGKSWYFITIDYGFGAMLEKETSAVVKAAGGSVIGSVKHPMNASDFSSYLLQAQASKAQIVALATGGGDFINAVKAANEFGITKTARLVGLGVFINDVHSLGLKQTQGMYMTDTWYWDQNDESRKWAKRYFEKMKREPSSMQAADYSAVLQYLTAVKAIGTDDGEQVMAQLRKTKFNDMYSKNAYLREDGRVIRDLSLYQVKAPAESKYPWDYMHVIQTIPGEQAFMPKSESKCAQWK